MRRVPHPDDEDYNKRWREEADEEERQRIRDLNPGMRLRFRYVKGAMIIEYDGDKPPRLV